MKSLCSMLKLSFLLMIPVAINIAGCVSTPVAREQAAVNDNVQEQVLVNDNVRSVWVFYGVALVKWDSEHQESNPVDREAFARGEVAALWEEMKQSDPKMSEKTLDELVLVKTNGFMREYVWAFLKSPDWTMPGNLRLEAFDEWRQDNLEKHEPNNVLRLIEPQPEKQGKSKEQR